MGIINFLKSFTSEQWIAIGTVFLGATTFFAVLVALFQEKIKGFFTKAKLNMAINFTPPDSHFIDLTNPRSGEFISKSLYIRIRITHLKGYSAEDVEIMISNFWEIREDGSKAVRRSFLPMNLKWSHFQPARTNIRVPRGLFRFCDLGRLQPVQNNTVLILDTMVQPNPVADEEIPNIIPPGKYEFELLLSGSNTKIITKKWFLEFKREWVDNEEMMLHQLNITEVNS